MGLHHRLLCSTRLPPPPSLPSAQAELTKGTFCGLALDQDNQEELTEGRVAAWTSQVLGEMGLKE